MEFSDLIQIDDLPTLPDTFYRLNEAVNDERISFDEIGEIISSDPALTVRLLRMVNSAFYGFSSRIDTVSHALSVIGTEQLSQLVLATSVMGQFRGIPCHLLDMRLFWEHSICCGLAARSMATLNGKQNVERFFVAGLLHDIGRLVMCLQAPEMYRKVLEYAHKSGDRLFKAEGKFFGFDHSMVGGALLKAWKLPESLEMTVAYHHRPHAAESYSEESAVIHLADSISHSMHLGGLERPDRITADPDIWGMAGLNEKLCLPTIKKKIRQQFEDVSCIFLQAA